VIEGSEPGSLALGGKDPRNPNARFADHENLYVEPRPSGGKLTPRMVFEHLVAKGLFRIGVELTCPTCRLKNWIALDILRQTNTCVFCGVEFDGSQQLVVTEFRYRRSGILGLKRNIQGAVPVVLTLQQLYANLSFGYGRAYSPSYDLEPKP
jgi:hypothetical protein